MSVCSEISASKQEKERKGHNERRRSRSKIESGKNSHSVAASLAVLASSRVAGANSVLARVAWVTFLALGAAVIRAALDVNTAKEKGSKFGSQARPKRDGCKVVVKNSHATAASLALQSGTGSSITLANRS